MSPGGTVWSEPHSTQDINPCVRVSEILAEAWLPSCIDQQFYEVKVDIEVQVHIEGGVHFEGRVKGGLQ